MGRLRRLLLAVAVIGAFAGIASTRAFAATPAPPPCDDPAAQQNAVYSTTPPSTGPNYLSSAHFDLWYSGDPTSTDYITETQAGDLLAFAEQEYASYAALGYPAPAVDPMMGRVEIYVINLSTYGLSSVSCDGSYYFDSTTVGGDGEAISSGWDVFMQVQNSLGGAGAEPWLTQAIAQWASTKVNGYPAGSASDIGPFEMSLDCWDYTWGGSKCSKNGYENLALSRWPFYEYLAERFGNGFITELVQDASSTFGIWALQDALVAHGTTLVAAYEDFTTKVMAGGWTASVLDLSSPPISGAPILTGAATGDVAPHTFSVDHLATRYVEIDRGDGSSAHPCYAASLALTVQIPSGVPSQPVFYWNGTGGTPIPLAVSGSTATTTVPWDTCLWQNKGFLSLPNASLGVNGANFVVSAHLTVDTTTPATASPPPAPSSTYGQVIGVGSGSLAPTITVFGPQVLPLSSSATQIRLIVESDGEGSLKAALGTLSLGTGSLRPGENDLRFTVPASALTALRRSADATSVLTLTPVSSDGTVTGKAVTRQVSITPSKTAKAAPKAKPKAKPKTKPKSKPKPKSKGHK